MGETVLVPLLCKEGVGPVASEIRCPDHLWSVCGKEKDTAFPGSPCLLKKATDCILHMMPVKHFVLFHLSHTVKLVLIIHAESFKRLWKMQLMKKTTWISIFSMNFFLFMFLQTVARVAITGHCHWPASGPPECSKNVYHVRVELLSPLLLGEPSSEII